MTDRSVAAGDGQAQQVGGHVAGYRMDSAYVINRSGVGRSVFYVTSRNNRCVAECWSEAMAKRITRLLNDEHSRKAPAASGERSDR